MDLSGPGAPRRGTRLRKIPVLVDHDPALRVGEVGLLYVMRNWIMADFNANDAPDDVEFYPGQPVSISVDRLLVGSRGVLLREVSLVSRGAIEGAEIISRWEIPRTEPAREEITHRGGTLVRHGIGKVLR